jgi:hypothetical protein
MFKTITGSFQRLCWPEVITHRASCSQFANRQSPCKDIALLARLCQCSLALVLCMPGALCGTEYQRGNSSPWPVESFLAGVDARLPVQKSADFGYRPETLPISNYCGDSTFSPSANTFTSVSRTTAIDLPYSSSVPVGAVIGLAVSGLQKAVALRTGEGTNDEVIVVDGTRSVDSITLRPGDELFLVNKGGGYWSLVAFLHWRQAATD